MEKKQEQEPEGNKITKELLLGKRMMYNFPTRPFEILEPLDQEIAEFYVANECRAADYQASKLGN